MQLLEPLLPALPERLTPTSDRPPLLCPACLRPTPRIYILLLLVLLLLQLGVCCEKEPPVFSLLNPP